MLLRSIIFLALALSASGPTLAQTYTLPEIGLQNSGSVRSLAVKDRTTNTYAPIGGLSNGIFTSTPGAVQLKNTLSPLDVSLAGTPGQSFDMFNPNAIMLGVGNQVSFCPRLSCLTTPSIDHQRSSLLVSATTQADGAAEEQTVGITTTINKGAKKEWANSKNFSAGDNIAPGNNTVYRQTTANCTSAASGSFPNTNKGTNIADGTCRWDWINDSAINTKLSLYVETKAIAGAGFSEGITNNFEMGPGFDPKQGATGAEFDFFNNSGTDCTKADGCIGMTINFGGSNKVTSGLQLHGVTGPAPLIWGFRIVGGNVASEIDIDVGSNAKIGLGFGANGIDASHHDTATVQDNSSGPVSYLNTAAHTDTVFKDTAGAPTGLSLGGTYTNGISLAGTFSGSQIAGKNFAVFPSGGVRANDLVVAPDSGHQLSIGYDVNADLSRIQSTHVGSFNTTLSLNPDGGGVQIGPNGLILPQYTVANLPSCAAAARGRKYAVTDASGTISYRAAPAGGGAQYAEVSCNGSAYEYH